MSLKMPLNKKCKVVPEREPGIARRYLIENFSSLPSAADIKIGHIAKKTLNADIKRLVLKILDKYKNVSNEKVFKKFAAICSEPFNILAEDDTTMSEPNVPSENNDMQAPGIPTCIPSQCRQEPQALTTDIQFQPIPSTSNGTPSTPDIRPISTTSSSMRSTHTSSTAMTPRKMKMKKRLAFLASSNQNIKKAYLDIARTARARIKTPKRVLNQAIKRKMGIIRGKDEQIRELKEGPLALKFSEAKQKFAET